MIGDWRLNHSTLVVTLEPCPMCAAAGGFAGSDHIVFGASVADARNAGFTELQEPCKTIFDVSKLNPTVYPGIMQADCVALFDAPV